MWRCDNCGAKFHENDAAIEEQLGEHGGDEDLICPECGYVLVEDSDKNDDEY